LGEVHHEYRLESAAWPRLLKLANVVLAKHRSELRRGINHFCLTVESSNVDLTILADRGVTKSDAAGVGPQAVMKARQNARGRSPAALEAAAAAGLIGSPSCAGCNPGLSELGVCRRIRLNGASPPPSSVSTSGFALSNITCGRSRNFDEEILSTRTTAVCSSGLTLSSGVPNGIRSYLET
jgi:hypothetical protein